MVIYERDRQILPSHHNRPLYVTAYVCDMGLRRALIDPASSLNIKFYSMLKAMEISRDRIIEQLLKFQVSEVVHHSQLAITTST